MMSNFVEFYIERFSLCIYMIDPSEFEVKMDSDVTDGFCLRNNAIIENHRGRRT